MSLPPGTRLGPYEIGAPLGGGGMRAVYRARDTRLDRTAAIKVLAEALARDPQFRERLEREARTISQLNHPHICALHDIGRDGDEDYLVLEYLEGEPLATRLARGPIPIDRVLTFGVQIADALAAAHRRGIVHRDLKPANVMLTKGGGGSPHAKLLDFGLARAATVVASAPGTAVAGYLVFARDGTLMAARFDTAALAIRGEPQALADGVYYSQTARPQ